MARRAARKPSSESSDTERVPLPIACGHSKKGLSEWPSCVLVVASFNVIHIMQDLRAALFSDQARLKSRCGSMSYETADSQKEEFRKYLEQEPESC